jgi:hypothetical protein
VPLGEHRRVDSQRPRGGQLRLEAGHEVDWDHQSPEEGPDALGQRIGCLRVARPARDRRRRREDRDARLLIERLGADVQTEGQEGVRDAQSIDDPEGAPGEGHIERQRRLTIQPRDPAAVPGDVPIPDPLRVEVGQLRFFAQSDQEPGAAGLPRSIAVEVEEPEALEPGGGFDDLGRRHPQQDSWG